MIAANLTKVNGVWYKAGDEIPLPSTDTKAETVAEAKESAITKEEVDKMQYFSLKALAQKNGISFKDKKAAQLRREIIERLGL